MTWEQGIYDALDARTTARGQIELPCIPAACGHYCERLNALFRQLGKELTPAELAEVQKLVAERLAQGWQESMGAKLVAQYEVTVTAKLQKNLAFGVSLRVPSLDEQFRKWLKDAQDQPFGAHADARVLDAARKMTVTDPVRVLDIGAGGGRNAIRLARDGHTVDAIERSLEMVRLLRTNAERAGVSIRVVEGDACDETLRLPGSHYDLAVASEVVTHFRDQEQLRQFLRQVCEALRPGGHVVFNMFLWRGDGAPPELVRQASRLAWASLFTRGELEAALAGLPLRLVAEESVMEFERSHLPADAWPPTPWFVAWATGRSISPSGPPPMELRWLEYERG